jgi:hypothetical protein
MPILRRHGISTQGGMVETLTPARARLGAALSSTFDAAAPVPGAHVLSTSDAAAGRSGTTATQRHPVRRPPFHEWIPTWPDASRCP